MVVCVFQVHGATAESFWIWVEDPDNNHIYHSEYFLLHKKQVPLYNNASPKLELIKPPVVALCFFKYLYNHEFHYQKEVFHICRIFMNRYIPMKLATSIDFYNSNL